MHVGGTLRKVQFLRVPLHTYNVMIAKINLAKSSSITRAFIIVTNNDFILTTSFLTICFIVVRQRAVSCKYLPTNLFYNNISVLSNCKCAKNNHQHSTALHNYAQSRCIKFPVNSPQLPRQLANVNPRFAF